MSTMHTLEGKVYLMKVGYSGEETKPDNFFLGLYAGACPAVGDDMTDMAAQEIAGSGYSRIAIPADGTGCVVTNDGTRAIVTFAQGTLVAAENWGTVVGGFLCDGSAGTSCNLLFAGDFASVKTIDDTDTLKVTPVYTQV